MTDVVVMETSIEDGFTVIGFDMRTNDPYIEWTFPTYVITGNGSIAVAGNLGYLGNEDHTQRVNLLTGAIEEVPGPDESWILGAGIVVNAAGTIGYSYSLSPGGSNVVVIDLTTNTSITDFVVSFGSDISDVALSPDEATLWVCFFDGFIIGVDTGTYAVGTPIATVGTCDSIAVVSNTKAYIMGNYIEVTLYNFYVQAIDLGGLVGGPVILDASDAPIPGPDSFFIATAIGVTPDLSTAYVSGGWWTYVSSFAYDNNAWAIDPGSDAVTVAYSFGSDYGGFPPDYMAFTADSSVLYLYASESTYGVPLDLGSHTLGPGLTIPYLTPVGACRWVPEGVPGWVLGHIQTGSALAWRVGVVP